MGKDKTLLQPQCPACRATGPMVLVVATTQKWREIGSPVIQCCKCNALWGLDQFIREAPGFFAQVPLI